MNGMAAGALQPTWFGHVTTARDALMLFEACLNGTLYHVPRRPHDRERAQLIKSGCVFIYEENASGIKRWTDGVPWSPSRILGNFLVYRELVKPFPPGEKKRATKKSKRPPRPNDAFPRSTGSDDPTSPTTPNKPDTSVESREQERALIGSLVDSYGFKEGGLVKKTMSVIVNNVHHHLVSYYRIEDALDGTLKPPSADPRLAGIEPRTDLILRQNFRAPLDENDETFQDPINGGGPPPGYVYAPYGRPNMMVTSPTHPHSSMGMPYSPLSPGPPHIQTALGYDASQVPPSPGYYATSSGMTSPIKGDGYENYNAYMHPSKPPDHTGGYPASSPTYAYRHNSSGSIPSLMSPNSSRGEWDRGQSNLYGPHGGSSGAMHPSYANNAHQWSMSSTNGPNLPSPNSGWGAQEQSWSIPSPHGSRSNSYAPGPSGAQ